MSVILEQDVIEEGSSAGHDSKIWKQSSVKNDLVTTQKPKKWTLFKGRLQGCICNCKCAKDIHKSINSSQEEE